MPTRLFTSFMMPNTESIVEEKICYWIDVVEDYDTVFEQKYPITPPSSTLEARKNFSYTKLDGTRFSAMPAEICGFEEISE